jgi:hypothetical protein
MAGRAPLGFNECKKREFNMSLRKSVMAAAVAVSMVAVPTIANAAQASAASTLSVRAAPAVQKAVRTGAAKNDASKLAGGSMIIAALAAVAVIVGIILISDGSDSP